ncbi:tRNA (adenosine(37)-N6)-threonylcarbamoyltransferase complex ATPase subunit type 1 TsaE [Stappia sp.]|uniref:tRNA (adenosine(37)-N6)-threonylcarbamoyltransferase complex ATPase subunit type 1 TsaE n=1 Tax=Stappia sp. TaxID=1870903 RepID=UPI003D0F19E6
MREQGGPAGPEHDPQELPITIELVDEAATARFAEDIAMLLGPGDCVCLVGGLGAGKSTFARALLRALADDEALEVPSPTFTLVQSYQLTRFPVAHLDLYRLEDEEELDELGLDDVLQTGAALVEWPERAASRLPAARLVVRFEEGKTATARRAGLLASDPVWRARVERTLAIRELIGRAGFSDAQRRYFQGDASPRRYETVRSGARRAILMNAAPPPAQPVLSDGLSYRQLVHLADGVDAVVAVAEALRARGLAAPRTLAVDVTAGLVLQEDLGRGAIVENGAPVPELYLAAAGLLAHLHQAPPEPVLPLPATGGPGYVLPEFDVRALTVEAELFLDWYLAGSAVPGSRESFLRAWQPLLAQAASGPRNWVLRDFHSPNLIWRKEEDGLARLGVVDTQDAMIGPAAYDVASLAMDARVDIPVALERDIVACYVGLRRQADSAFDEAEFRRQYAIMAAQRATKILGVFTRLAVRDGKPAYLVHIPRVRDYLARALAHPDLHELADWFWTQAGIGSSDGQ